MAGMKAATLLKLSMLKVPRSLIRPLLYVVCYLVLHWGSYVFVLPDFRVTPWNPETGLSFLFASLHGLSTFPALFIANVVGEYATGHLPGAGGMLLRGALYAGSYVTLGTIFRAWSSADRPASLAQTVKLLITSLLAAFLFGSLLVTSISWFTRIPSLPIISAMTTSATGDLIGILSIAPLYLAWSTGTSLQSLDIRSLSQLAAGFLIIVTASFVVFGLDMTDQFKFFYVVLLPVVAFSLLYGYVGAALSVFTSDLIMIVIIYGRDVAPGTATELQILMITLSATGLLLGSVVSERSRLSDELLESHQRLGEAQSRLLHASRVLLINEMASAIAHEINQPLSAIRNYCRAIQRLISTNKMNKDKLGLLVDAAIEQVDAASGIINDTRRFVRRESPTKARASLLDCAALSLRLLHQEIVKNRVRIKVEVPQDMQVGMPPVRLQQVLLNLLRNAIESVSEQRMRTIEIAAKQLAQGRVLVTVRDSGVGIPENIRRDLFRPFATTKDHGLGLGLSLSRSIVNEYGGELWCENSSSDGTTMSFTINEIGRQ